MYDLISIGNICIDLYFQGNSLTENNNRFELAIGGKYFSDTFHEDVGGGAVNVASGITKQGLSCALFGIIGNNSFKEIIIKKLENKNIATQLCQFEDGYHKISTILLNKKGERTIINYETPTHLYNKFILHEPLKNAKNVFFSSLPNIYFEDKVKMINYLKGDQTLTFLNLSTVDCKKPITELNKIFNAIDVLIVNGYEFSEIIKEPYTKIKFKDFKISGISELKDKIVIVTDGISGSYGYFKDTNYFQPIIQTKIVDTTGAGDGYTAGFIAQYLKSKDIKKSMENGARYASKIISQIGPN